MSYISQTKCVLHGCCLGLHNIVQVLLKWNFSVFRVSCYKGLSTIYSSYIQYKIAIAFMLKKYVAVVVQGEVATVHTYLTGVRGPQDGHAEGQINI